MDIAIARQPMIEEGPTSHSKLVHAADKLARPQTSGAPPCKPFSLVVAADWDVRRPISDVVQ